MSYSVIINNPIITSRKVVAIPRSMIVQKSIIDSALKTHEDLTSDDRIYFLSLLDKLCDKKLAKFVAQIYKLSNTGRFSLTYNMLLDKYIKNKNKEKILTLVEMSGKEKAWPELYNNKRLDEEEIETVETMNRREVHSILNTVETADGYDSFENIIPCQAETLDTLAMEEKGLQYSTIYSDCYNNICISESQQKGKIVSLNSDIPQIAYVADEQDRTKYCFNLMDLIERLANGNYINSQSGRMFSKTTLDQILTKYEKEIKMY